MVPKLTNAEIIERVSTSRYRDRGVGLLITGPSRAERSTIANKVLSQFYESGHYCMPCTPFELVAAYHFGQSEQLRRRGVLWIKELGSLSRAEENAVDLIQPCLTVTGILEAVLDERHQCCVTTLVTTEHELAELAAQFSPRLVSLLGAVGFSIRLDSQNEASHVD